VGKHAQGLGHNLGSDVVSGKNGEFDGWHTKGVRASGPRRRWKGEFSRLHVCVFRVDWQQ
jgi:hypothetical protein